ncbi:hypothetical protein T484DRAFT_1760525, partial [Baffinella frigidus]
MDRDATAKGPRENVKTAEAYASASVGPKKAGSKESPSKVRTKGAKGTPGGEDLKGSPRALPSDSSEARALPSDSEPKEASKEGAEAVDEDEGGAAGETKAASPKQPEDGNPKGAGGKFSADDPGGYKAAKLSALRDKEAQRKLTEIDTAKCLRVLTSMSPLSRARVGYRERERGASVSPSGGEQGDKGWTTLPKVRRTAFLEKRPAWELAPLGGKLPTPSKDGVGSGV